MGPAGVGHDFAQRSHGKTEAAFFCFIVTEKKELEIETVKCATHDHCVLAPIDPLTWCLCLTSSFVPFTILSTAKTKAKLVNVEPSAQIEQTKT